MPMSMAAPYGLLLAMKNLRSASVLEWDSRGAQETGLSIAIVLL